MLRFLIGGGNRFLEFADAIFLTACSRSVSDAPLAASAFCACVTFSSLRNTTVSLGCANADLRSLLVTASTSTSISSPIRKLSPARRRSTNMPSERGVPRPAARSQRMFVRITGIAANGLQPRARPHIAVQWAPLSWRSPTIRRARRPAQARFTSVPSTGWNPHLVPGLPDPPEQSPVGN